MKITSDFGKIDGAVALLRKKGDSSDDKLYEFYYGLGKRSTSRRVEVLERASVEEKREWYSRERSFICLSYLYLEIEAENLLTTLAGPQFDA